MACAAVNISDHYNWKNIFKWNIFHGWPFILWIGLVLILFCTSISYIIGLSHTVSVDFCFIMEFSCVVVHNNYFVANDNIKAEN